MKGHLFIAPGDITQFHAHTIAFSASSYLGCDGNLYSAFAANVAGFAEWYGTLRQRPDLEPQVGDTFWMPLTTDRQPHGVVVAIATGRGRTGGVIATAAWRRTCGGTATAAGATWPDSTRTRAGTTVAAARFANCWLMTCGGGSAVVGCTAMIVLILVMLTLVILTLRI